MSRLAFINKPIGALTIGLNIFIYIPWSWGIIQTGGGSQGWGLIFLPGSLFFHLFVVTGIFAWLGKHRLQQKVVRTTVLFVWIMLCLSLMLYFGWLGTLLVAIGFLALYLPFRNDWHMKLRTEQSILLLNMAGAALMIAAYYFLGL